MFCRLATRDTSHPPKSTFTKLAPQKVLCRVVREVVIHEFKPVPANFDAPLNVSSKLVTLPTFHVLRSAFISRAELKV